MKKKITLFHHICNHPKHVKDHRHLLHSIQILNLFVHVLDLYIQVYNLCYQDHSNFYQWYFLKMTIPLMMTMLNKIRIFPQKENVKYKVMSKRSFPLKEWIEIPITNITRQNKWKKAVSSNQTSLLNFLFFSHRTYPKFTTAIPTLFMDFSFNQNKHSFFLFLFNRQFIV